jgi:hypothetical protein
MSEFADYFLEEVENEEEARLNFRTGKLSNEEAYDRGIIDELGFEIGSGLTYKSCKWCNKSGLHWVETKMGWRLAEQDNKLHTCVERAAVSRHKLGTFNMPIAEPPSDEFERICRQVCMAAYHEPPGWDNEAAARKLKSLLKPQLDEFKRIKDLAEEACKLAVDDSVNYCANKGDLHCIEVVRCMGENGEVFWLVTIEEAAPDEHKLHNYIIAHLAKHDINARVITEW